MADPLVAVQNVDMTSFAGAIKNLYDKKWQTHIPTHVEGFGFMGGSDAISEETPLDGSVRSSVNTGFGNVGGKTWIMGGQIRRGMSGGFRAEALNGQTSPMGLPPSQDAGYINPQVSMKLAYSTFRITHPTMRMIKKGSGASWLNAVDSAMIDPVMSLLTMLDVYCCGDGTGILADITIPGGSFVAAGAAITVNTSKFLFQGQAVDVFGYDGTNWKAMTAGTGGTANADPNDGNPTLIRISSIPNATTIKLDKPVHLTAGGGLIASATRAVFCNFGDCYIGDANGVYSATTGSLFFLGIPGFGQMIDNGSAANPTFQAINRGAAGYEQYSSFVASASSGYDQIAHGIRAVQACFTFGMAKRNELSAMCSPVTFRSLYRYVENGGVSGPSGAQNSKTRFTGAVQALDGVMPTIAGVPLEILQNLKDGDLSFCRKDDFEVMQTENAQYDDTDGSIFARVRGLAAFTGFFFWYLSPKYEKPSAGAKINNIPVTNA